MFASSNFGKSPSLEKIKSLGSFFSPYQFQLIFYYFFKFKIIFYFGFKNLEFKIIIQKSKFILEKKIRNAKNTFQI